MNVEFATCWMGWRHLPMHGMWSVAGLGRRSVLVNGLVGFSTVVVVQVLLAIRPFMNQATILPFQKPRQRGNVSHCVLKDRLAIFVNEAVWILLLSPGPPVHSSPSGGSWSFGWWLEARTRGCGGGGALIHAVNTVVAEQSDEKARILALQWNSKNAFDSVHGQTWQTL